MSEYILRYIYHLSPNAKSKVKSILLRDRIQV